MAKEISNNGLFELMTKLYNRMESMDSEIQEIKRAMATKDELREVKDRVILIEEHSKKEDLLFDGYKQNFEKLDRIEKEVTRHE